MSRCSVFIREGCCPHLRSVIRLFGPPFDQSQLYSAFRAKGPREGPASASKLQTAGSGMQVRPSSRERSVRVGDDDAILGKHETHQVGHRGALATTDARADDHAQLYLVPPAPGCSASERMSIRHPVSRAARRAFCPSRPIASDN